MHRSRFANTPWIKICGITDPETAKACVKFGSDAIGLVFFKKSPRYVTKKQAAAITQILPPAVKSIGVFVDAAYDCIMETVEKCHLDGVQLHGTESPELVEKLLIHDLIIIKALFAKKAPFLHKAKDYASASCLLVEYGKGPLPGGNAEPWDYRQCQNLADRYPIILAGGLRPDTVSRAISNVAPQAVDVSSGVEIAPGTKDLGKVKQFIEAVKLSST